MQQVGGSIGTALLSTVAATAATGFMDGRAPSPENAALAAVQSYTTTFWWAAAIFVVGAAISAFLLPRGLLPAPAEGQPAMAH